MKKIIWVIPLVADMMWAAVRLFGWAHWEEK